MEIIKIKSFTELLLLLISITGQIKNDFYANMDITDTYARKCVSELIKDKKIKRCTYEYGTYLRLKKPSGMEQINQMAGTLLERYMDATYGHKFSNRIEYVKRMGNMSEVNNLIVSIKWPLDNLQIEYEANIFGRGTGAATRSQNPTRILMLTEKGVPLQPLGQKGIQDSNRPPEKMPVSKQGGERSRQGGAASATGPYCFEEYLSESLRVGTEYFTSRVIKRVDKETYNLRINLSRFYGVIISDGGIYPVYFIGQELVEWEPGAEQSLNIYIPSIAERSRGRSYSVKMFDRYKNGAGVFLVKDYNILTELMSNGKQGKQKKKSTMVSPLTIYGNAFVIPINRKLAEPVLKLITLDEWQEYAKKIIFTIDERKRATAGRAKQILAEAVLDDGSYSWEMISCDISKLRHISNLRIEKEVTIICYPWQEETIKKVMGESVNTETVDPEEITKKIKSKKG